MAQMLDFSREICYNSRKENLLWTKIETAISALNIAKNCST